MENRRAALSTVSLSGKRYHLLLLATTLPDATYGVPYGPQIMVTGAPTAMLRRMPEMASRVLPHVALHRLDAISVTKLPNPISEWCR